MTSWKSFFVLGLLGVSLFCGGCKIASCDLKSKSFSGHDTLPDSKLQAGTLIAGLEMDHSIEIQYAPPEGHVDSLFPPAPFDGSDVLTVKVDFEDREFSSDYSYDWDYGTCYAHTPSADADLVIKSKSGRFDARVPGSALVQGGTVEVSGSLHSLHGAVAGFLPDLDDNQSQEIGVDAEFDGHGTLTQIDVVVRVVTSHGNERIHTSRYILSSSNDTEP